MGGCVTHWYVQNRSTETVTVKIWTSKKSIPPGQTAWFQYACHSKLPGTVWRADGSQSWHADKMTFDWIPGDHILTVEPNFTLMDRGKTKRSKNAEDGVKAAISALARMFA